MVPENRGHLVAAFSRGASWVDVGGEFVRHLFQPRPQGSLQQFE